MDFVSGCSEISYAKIPNPGDVESDASSDFPILTPSESTIPTDLEVVIKAWPSLTEEAKKKILVVVKDEKIRSLTPSLHTGEPDINNNLEQDTGNHPPAEIDRDLANFIASWPALEQTQQQALLTLVGVPREPSGGLPHNQIESPEVLLSSTPSSRHSRIKTFASSSSKELFSDSEWSKLIEHLALPERQVDILYLLLHGKNDKEIARKLKISQPTLRTHLQRMHGRFNVPNRTSLVIELFRFARHL